jgi:hypothetical protein
MQTTEGSDKDTAMLIRLWNELIEALINSESPERRLALLSICNEMLRLPNQQIELSWAYEKLVLMLTDESEKENQRALFIQAEGELTAIDLRWEMARQEREEKSFIGKLIGRLKIRLGISIDMVEYWKSRYFEQLEKVNALLLTKPEGVAQPDVGRVDEIELPGFDRARYQKLLGSIAAPQPSRHRSRSSVEELVGKLDAGDIETIEMPDPNDDGVLKILYSAKRESSRPAGGASFEEYVSQIIGTPAASHAEETPPSSGTLAELQLVSALLDSSTPPSGSEPEELYARDIISISIPSRWRRLQMPPSSRPPPKRRRSGFRAINK